MKNYALVLCMLPLFLMAIDYNVLKKELPTISANSPFDYPLNITLMKGRTADARVMLALHGYGGDHNIGAILQSYGDIPDHLISFDFPDHNILERQLNLNEISFGTIKELLPAIFILKKLIIDLHLASIDLYGFSGGGGALVNILTVLNTNQYDDKLKNIGISAENKKTILDAIQKGWVLLDSPLKSIPEIVDFRGHNEELDTLVNLYQVNQLVPIDNISKLIGLKLNVMMYFENPDEVIPNRDDKIFAQKFMEANPNGKNIILEGSSGGHMSYHKKLFNTFKQQLLKN